VGLIHLTEKSHQISPITSAVPLLLSDAAELFKLIQANRTLLAEYLYWLDSVIDVQSTEQYISERVDSGMPGAQWFKLIVDGKLAGIFGVKSVFEEKQRAEIGYWLGSAFHGKGVMKSAIRYFQKHLANLQIDTLMICVLSENSSSINLATALGAQLAERKENYMTLADRNQDLLVFHLC